MLYGSPAHKYPATLHAWSSWHDFKIRCWEFLTPADLALCISILQTLPVNLVSSFSDCYPRNTTFQILFSSFSFQGGTKTIFVNREITKGILINISNCFFPIPEAFFNIPSSQLNSWHPEASITIISSMPKLLPIVKKSTQMSHILCPSSSSTHPVYYLSSPPTTPILVPISDVFTSEEHGAIRPHCPVKTLT